MSVLFPGARIMAKEVKIARFVSFSSLLSSFAGSMGLAGCFFHVPILRTVVPGMVAIAANTSICLILLGISLWYMRERNGLEAGSWSRWLAKGAAAAAALVGFLSLGEYLGNLDYGIDQLLFIEPEPAISGPIRPGLMSPVTSLMLILLGLALLLLDWTTRRHTWPAQVLCLLSGIIAIFTLLDLIFDPRHLRAHIALPTVTVLSVLPFAVICARPKRALGGLLLASKSTRKSLVRQLLLPPRLGQGPGAPVHYALVVILVTAATLLRYWLAPYLPEAVIFLTYYPAVMIAALLGGLGPGILATVLAATCANYFFLSPVGVFTIANRRDLLALLMFIAIGLAISWLASTLEQTREEAAATLRQSENELREAQHVAHIGSWKWDPASDTSTWSAEMYEIFGRDPEQPPPAYKEHLQYTGPEGAALEDAAVQNALKTGQSYEFDLEIALKDGARKWIINRGTPDRDPEGRITGLHGTVQDITERKRAEEAVRSNEQRYRTLFESAGDAIFVMKDAIFVDCNEVATQTFGCSREQIIGHTPSEFSPRLQPDGRSSREALERIHRAARTTEVVRFEWLYCRADKTAFHASVSLKNFKVDGKGYVIAIVKDISARKKIEKALRESEEKFSKAYSSGPAVTTLSDIQDGDRLLEVNHAFTEILGYPRDEVLGRTTDELGLWVDPAEHARAVADLLQHGGFRNMELRFRKKNGDTGLGLFSKESIELGGRVCAITTAIDISERKRAEEDLRASENRIHRLLEGLSQGVFLKDRNSVYILVNQAYCRLVGLKVDAADFVGKTDLDFYPPELAEKYRVDDTRVMDSGQTEEIEDVVQFPDGTRSTVQVVKSPFRNEKGEIVGLLGIFWDISERKQAEARVSAERQKFNTILDSVPPYVVLLTADYHVGFANREFRARFGEHQGRKCYELLFNRTEPCEVCETYKVLTDDRPRNWQWTGPDGCHYDVFDFPFTDTDGSKLILEMGIDVTERNKAQAALEAERRRFEAVLETLPVMICLLTPDHDVAFANLAFRKQFGECRGRKCHEYLFGKNAPCEFCEAYQVLETNAPHDWECPVKSGRLVHAFDMPFIDVDGSPLILEMDIDVTEQRQAEKKLRHSEEELKEAQRVARLGNWTMDRTGNVSWSEQLFRMLGLEPSAEAPPFFTHQQLFTPESWKRLAPAVDNTARTGEPYELELETVLPDGRHGWMLARGEAVRNNGDISGLRGVALDITERKRAEFARAESERQFSTLAELVPQFVWMCDSEGLSFYFNQRWFDYTGLSKEESYGRGWNTPFHPDDKQAAWNAWSHATATGETYQVESRLRAADGSYRWFLMRGTPLRDDSGSIVRWFGTCTDIDDLKRIEAELSSLNQELDERVRQRTSQLEAANARLGIAQRAAMAGLWHWDMLTGKLTWSVELFELFGLPATEQASFETWQRILHPGDRESAEAAIDHAIKDRKPLENEYRIVLPGRQERWIRAVGNTTYDENGVPLIMSGICLDITDRKRAEKALRESESRFRTLSNSVPDLVWTCTPDGKCDYVNSRYIEYTGVPAEELLGFEWLTQVHPDDRERAVSEWKKSLEGDAEYESDYRIRNRRGVYRYFKCRGAALKDANGRALKWFGTNTDIEDLRRLQEELAAANKELESFNYAVAHDLRAPLRHIHGFAELLAEEAAPFLNESAQRHLHVIRESIERMGQLLQELLNLSRLGRQELRKQACDLNLLVQHIVAELKPDIENREIEWRIADLPALDCDTTLMKQVLWNLISNAVKFTRKRSPAVIEIGKTVQNGVPVVFIRDNGEGFEMKYADKLFGIFQRLHRREEFEGTGVGLAIVQRIIHRHGGSVWAEAEPNRGATFYFTLQPCEIEDQNVT